MGSTSLSQLTGLSHGCAPLQELRQAAYAAIWSMTESDEDVNPQLAYSLLARIAEFDQGALTEDEFRRAIASDLEVADRDLESRSSADIWDFIEDDVSRFVRSEIVFNDLVDRIEDAGRVLSNRGSWPDPEFESLLRLLDRAVASPAFRAELILALQRWLRAMQYQPQKLSS